MGAIYRYLGRPNQNTTIFSNLNLESTERISCLATIGLPPIEGSLYPPSPRSYQSRMLPTSYFQCCAELADTVVVVSSASIGA